MSKLLIACLLVTVTTCKCQTTNTTGNATVDFPFSLPLNFSEVRAQLLETMEKFSQDFFQQTFQPTLADPCLNSLVQFAKDLSVGKYYAVKALDAWGKVESGFFEGNARYLGQYSECKNLDSPSFKGKYFFTSLTLNNTLLKFELGTCFPDQCSAENVSALLQNFLPNVKVHVTPPKEFKTSSPTSILGIFMLALVFTIVLIATLYDVILCYLKKKTPADLDESDEASLSDESTRFQRIALSISAIGNTKRLLNTDQKSGDIHCLHGIRFLSMAWIILGHVVLTVSGFTDNPIYLVNYVLNSWTFQAIVNATFSVDTFFFLSGLLVAYLGMRELNRSNGKMNIPLMYCYRYIRLTPAYAFAILMYVSVWPLLGSGPLWNFMSSAVDICESKWWTNLLYINNIYPGALEKQCFSWGWYLANDMQFYLLSPLFLYLMYRYKKIALAIMSLVLVVNLILTGTFSRITEQQPNMLETVSWSYYVVKALPKEDGLVTDLFIGPVPADAQQNSNKFLEDIYTKPWCRIGAYLVGMAVGYLLHVKNNQVKMHKAVAICGWTAAVVTSVLIMFGLYPTLHSMEFFDLDTAAFYNAVTRPAWCFCVGWVVIACTSGYGAWINTLLSWKTFIPLSRLTYGLYLLHPLVINGICWSSEVNWHYSLLLLVILFSGSLLLSIVVAYFLYILVEAPVMSVMKIMLGKDQSKKTTEPPAKELEDKNLLQKHNGKETSGAV